MLAAAPAAGRGTCRQPLIAFRALNQPAEMPPLNPAQVQRNFFLQLQRSSLGFQGRALHTDGLEEQHRTGVCLLSLSNRPDELGTGSVLFGVQVSWCGQTAPPAASLLDAKLGESACCSLLRSAAMRWFCCRFLLTQTPLRFCLRPQVQATRELRKPNGSKCDAFDYQHATTNTTPHSTTHTTSHSTPDTTTSTASLNSRHCCRSRRCHCSEWQHLHRPGIRAQLQVLAKHGLERLCAPHHWTMGELHFRYYWRLEAESRTAVLDRGLLPLNAAERTHNSPACLQTWPAQYC